MLFIAGVSQKEKSLDHTEPRICEACGAYGRHQLMVRYSQLSLFFIPVFTWGREYFVHAQCCGSIFALSKAAGQAIERGERAHITKDDLASVKSGIKRSSHCQYCGMDLSPKDNFCPNCGSKR